MTLFVLAAAALLASNAAPAFAARGHEFEKSFGKPCAALPCTGKELLEPDGVAVNEASHDVYVVDKGAKRVVRFDAAGNFLSEFTGPSATGTGELEAGSAEVKGAVATTGAFSAGEEVSAPGIPAATTITAVEAGGTVLQLSAPAIAPETATLAAHQDFLNPETIAVDNACHLEGKSGLECAAFDPSDEDVYVEDEGGFEQRVIDKFTAAGEYLGQITEDASGHLHELAGVAVNRQGNLWVSQKGGVRELTKFSNDLVNTPSGPPLDLSFVLPGSNDNGLSLDPLGDFYVRYDTNVFKEGEFEARIAKVSPAGTLLAGELDDENSSAVAVDQATGVAYIDNLTSLAGFDSELNPTDRLGQGLLTKGAGIGIDASSEHVFVADASTGEVLDFGPQQPGAPTVEAAGQSVTEVTSDSAVLHSEVNPRSEAGEEPTTYSFQYGPCPSLAACASAPFPLSTPAATLPPDFEPRQISSILEGLAPGTTYHWRLSAQNSHSPEPTLGPEATFTTQTAGPFALPDSRQWELVSPPDKQGTIEPIAETGVIQAAAGGGAIAYLSNGPTETEPQGFSNRVQVLSSRGPASWSSRDIAIPHAGATGLGSTEYRFFDPELGLSVVQPFGEFSALSEEASEQTAYLRELNPSCGTHCYRPLVTGKPGFANVEEEIEFGEEEKCVVKGGGGHTEGPCGPEFLGASEDLSHVVLLARVGLQTGAAGGLYEWSQGALAPVSLLPGGGETPNGALGREGVSVRGAISSDGSIVVWSTATPPALYLRANATAPQSASGACDEPAKACTIQLDEAESCAGCTSGGGQFQIASVDGSRVLFTDAHRLTEDAGTGGSDLYECRVVEPTPAEPACDLTDLTPEVTGGAAEVQGGILGASADLSSVYLVARGVLASNVVENGAGPEAAQAGQPNLYLLHEGAAKFIARLSAGDVNDWSPALGNQPTRVSADGRFLALMAQGSPTGYDNRDVATGAPVAEVYIYDAQANDLSCAACDPSGSRPHGVEYEGLVPPAGLVGGPRDVWPSHALVGANLPGWTSIGARGPRHQPRYLSDSGRLFFNSVNGLVPQDSNGTQDVYQFEPPGVGGCTESNPSFSERNGGCVNLISAGISREESAFLDASESGDDVFFLTSSRLVPLDVDAALDVYDAHVCSAASPCLPDPPPPAPACAGDACQQPAVPPSDQTPGSLSFQGAGNLLQCPKGKIKRSGRCVKKHATHKNRHHKNKSHKRHAKTNRGAGK